MTSTWRGRGVVVWALAGVLALMLVAVVRLGANGVRTIASGLNAFEWFALAIGILSFGYAEGYRVFQCRAAPEIVARSLAVARSGCAMFVLLAPLYALSLVDGDRARAMRAWGLTAGIVVSIFVVRSLPAPWRGIVDASAAAALFWATVAILREVGRQARAAKQP